MGFGKKKKKGKGFKGPTPNSLGVKTVAQLGRAGTKMASKKRKRKKR